MDLKCLLYQRLDVKQLKALDWLCDEHIIVVKVNRLQVRQGFDHIEKLLELLPVLPHRTIQGKVLQLILLQELNKLLKSLFVHLRVVGETKVDEVLHGGVLASKLVHQG